MAKHSKNIPARGLRALSQQLQGRDIAQVMLLHHNLVNALWLDDVVQQFKARVCSIAKNIVRECASQLTPSGRR